ncbi:MAG: TlpA family protein disulfide reductase [Oscillospiraceae bacterium]|nr:TlpA family protein disulfide reductase [Oscillospiraceae bacterium]
MTKNIKTVLGIAGFALLMFAAVFAYNALGDRIKPDSGIGTAPGQSENSEKNTDKEKAPDFTVTDADGNSVRLSDMEGYPIVLNFWASWCPPCKLEMPDFEKVYRELGEEVQFMMVNLTDGQRETKGRAEAYISGEGHTFPVFFDTKQEGAPAYGIRSIPTTFFIDRDGYIVTGVQGALEEAALRQGIDMIR